MFYMFRQMSERADEEQLKALRELGGEQGQLRQLTERMIQRLRR